MHAPDEARLIERLWGLVCNSSDLKGTVKWVGDKLTDGGLSQSPDSVQWREAMKLAREEYHNWLSFYLYTHRQFNPQDPDAEPTIGELIECLRLVCNCGACDGVWISRYESELIQKKLKDLALHEHDTA
jgi:hypothetical protein